MISAILYGRNDAHGYNLHKRAAISLNCIAELMQDPDDEILFVDYNTPNDLPTFIEAIYDTLTPQAQARLRVFRVRPELHQKMVRGTHLVAVEPHSRNIALRRSNPANRWVLLTNTDMVFVPRDRLNNLDEVVESLPDAHYILPRFELPEPIWEAFPRTDPRAVIEACDKIGWGLHLNEIAVSHPYMRFDSPGDFQLMPRQVLFDIFGLDERMIHGWHVDSNLCKRLYIFYGDRTDSLEERLKGYHCDHTRVATLAHRSDLKLQNDLQEFVYGVDDPYARHQANTWGAPDEVIEELDLVSGPQTRLVPALEAALASAQSDMYRSDCNDLRDYVFYQQEHALPFLVGNLTVCPPGTRVAYIGNNGRMLELIGRAVSDLGQTEALHYVPDFLTGEVDAPESVPLQVAGESAADLAKYLVSNYDALIFDFGLDRRDANIEGPTLRVTDWPRRLRYSLGRVARCFAACAQASQERASAGESIPDLLVLNANHHVFWQFVSFYMLSTDTPWNTHVRKGRPRVGGERLYRSHDWQITETCMRSFFGYDVVAPGMPVAREGEVLDLTSNGPSSLWKDGHWGWADPAGTWIDGTDAHLLFGVPPDLQGDLVAQVDVTEAFIGVDDDPIRLQVKLNDVPLTRWEYYTRFLIAPRRVVLPKRMLTQSPECRLTFHIENPQSPIQRRKQSGEQFIGEDPSELGVRIRQVSFMGPAELVHSLGGEIDFRKGGRGIFHLEGSWSPPDNLGTWTTGKEATLALFLSEPASVPLQASFEVTDVAVNADHSDLFVDVFFNGERAAEWRLGPTRMRHEQHIVVPLEIVNRRTPLMISFGIRTPRSPAQLGWDSADNRQLGFRLTRLKTQPLEIVRYRLGDALDFTLGGNAVSFLGSQWSEPDSYGRWTTGETATLSLPLVDAAAGPVVGRFVISDCMVGESAPPLPVRVTVNGVHVADWLFGPDRVPHERTVPLPADLASGCSELTWTFEVPELRSPRALGWSEDPRLLGIRFTQAFVGQAQMVSSPIAPNSRPLRPIVRRVIRRLRRAVRHVV